MKFTFTASLAITVFTEVEAATKEEALAIAEERAVQTLPYEKHKDPGSVWCHTGELDGQPEDITLDEC